MLRAVVERLAELDDDVVATVGNARVPMPRGSSPPPVAGAEGHLDAMARYARAGVGSVTDVRPAAEVVARLRAALERRRSAWGGSTPRAGYLR